MRNLAFALALCAPLAAIAEARLTQSCNTNFATGNVFVATTVASEQVLLGLARNPAVNPDVYWRFWTPPAVDDIDYSAYPSGFALRFDSLQDTREIAESIMGDPVLRELGVVGADADTYTICFSPNPPPRRMTVTEYFNSNTGHYFLSPTSLDNAFIDSGGAGPAWARTGETLRTFEADYCSGSRPVFRFYTPIANTHFFTLDNAECGAVRRGGGWNYEGEAFGARAPAGGTCPANTTTVYRLYNNRWMYNDNNHRFVTRTALREQMVSQGWINEGIAMCVFN
jgi:hypothetical protein